MGNRVKVETCTTLIACGCGGMFFVLYFHLMPMKYSVPKYGKHYSGTSSTRGTGFVVGT